MATNELRAIEILLNSLTTKKAPTPLYKDEIDDFTNSKLHLFNRITINTLLKYYDNNVLFPKESFLENGIITGIYDSSIETPVLDLSYRNNFEEFYEKLISALKNNDYYFDIEGNICIDTNELDTKIFPIWLHRLAETMKESKYKNVYLFNKNKDARIYDETSLLTYLNQSKTFFVTYTNHPMIDSDETYNKTMKKTNNTISQKEQVKVDDIIDTFKKYTPEELNPEVSKFIIPTPVYIVKKANDMGSEFYNANINIQREYITKWLTEYIMSNDYNASSLQKTLLVKDINDLTRLPYNEKQKSICGLLTMLFTVLKHNKIDYDTISLSDIQLDTYLSNEHQETQIALNEIINLIDNANNSKVLTSTKKQIATLMDEINTLDSAKDREELLSKQEKINGLFNRYKKLELDQDKLVEKRNSLQNILYYHKTHDMDEIAFDNQKIAALINEAIMNGQIIINPLDSRKISIKITNKLTGKTTFEANIMVKELLQMIEDLNFQLEETDFKMAS